MDDEKTIKLRHVFEGSSSVKRVFIIVKEPGKTPDKKIPTQTHAGVTEFLIALQMCRPAGTEYTVVELIWDGDIWVQSGSEWLEVERLSAPRKFAKFKREVIAKHQQWTPAAKSDLTTQQ